MSQFANLFLFAIVALFGVAVATPGFSCSINIKQDYLDDPANRLPWVDRKIYFHLRVFRHATRTERSDLPQIKTELESFLADQYDTFMLLYKPKPLTRDRSLDVIRTMEKARIDLREEFLVARMEALMHFAADEPVPEMVLQSLKDISSDLDVTITEKQSLRPGHTRTDDDQAALWCNIVDNVGTFRGGFR